jgi:exodeoxyribonuclease VII small subunit
MVKRAKPTEISEPEIDISQRLPANWRYESTVAEIEAIIDQIERGDMPLSEVFDQFSTAVEQLRQCEGFLNRQQQQVDLLIETLDDSAGG